MKNDMKNERTVISEDILFGEGFVIIRKNERNIISEEKIFGEEFVILRRKYAFEGYKGNPVLNKKE